MASLQGDVLSVLPTGYGKTVVIQALPYADKQRATVLVVNPLNAIITEQQTRFGDRCLVVDDELIGNLKNGVNPDSSNIRYIIGHPEHLTDNVTKKYAQICLGAVDSQF